jgi:hypothetical protein
MVGKVIDQALGSLPLVDDVRRKVDEALTSISREWLSQPRIDGGSAQEPDLRLRAHPWFAVRRDYRHVRRGRRFDPDQVPRSPAAESSKENRS